MGHFGLDRVINLIRSRFYWPGVQKSVTYNPTWSVLNLWSWFHGLLGTVKYWTISKYTGFNLSLFQNCHGYSNHKSNRQNDSKSSLNHYGFPVQLHSDQGAKFTGKVISEMCRMLGVKRSTISAYHPITELFWICWERCPKTRSLDEKTMFSL